MTINICIPTLSRYDLLEKCIDSSFQGENKPENIFIVDNGNKLPEHLYHKYKYDTNFYVHSQGSNIGVAASWNWFLENVSHPMIICNDDLEFSTLDIDAFVNAYNNLDADFYYTDNLGGLNMFSCYMPTPQVVEKVGLFDEQFYPAYFEDNDYFKRMLIANVNFVSVPTKILHHGSATIKAFQPSEIVQHHENFRKNAAYYLIKWGGMPGKETYTSAWGR